VFKKHPGTVALILSLLMVLAGCAVNPVTGEQQLSLIPESRELAIGEEQYTPTQQLQGGRFYVDPELTLYVQEVGQKLARVSDRPDLPYEFVVLNNSVPNAWALPGGKIAVNRGLLTELEDEAQLAAVLGHEIVHAAARHSVQRLQQAQLITLGVAGLGIAVSDNEWAGLAIGAAALGAQLALAQYSQAHELEADHYGITYMKRAGYDPQAAVELQQLFVKLSEGRDQNFLQGLFATHPPSIRRVQENQALVAQVGAGGYRGRDVYQRKLSTLKRLQPAYDAHDKALELSTDERYREALAKINEAIRLLPREAMFYSLRGRIYQKLEQPEKAEADFSQAISLYPEMFEYQLRGGLSALELGKLDLARERLERANEVIPTAIAYLRLGDIAVRQGRRSDAVAAYSQAARSDDAIGAEARKKLAKLQLSQ